MAPLILSAKSLLVESQATAAVRSSPLASLTMAVKSSGLMSEPGSVKVAMGVSLKGVRAEAVIPADGVRDGVSSEVFRVDGVMELMGIHRQAQTVFIAVVACMASGTTRAATD